MAETDRVNPSGGVILRGAQSMPRDVTDLIGVALHALEQSIYNSTLWSRRPDHETHDDHHADCQECLYFGNPAFHRSMLAQQQRALEVVRLLAKTRSEP